MNETLERAFDVIIEDRVDNVAYRKLLESKTFLDLDQKIRDLEKAFLNSILTEEQREVFGELEELSNQREGLVMESAYRQGLKDSSAISQAISELELT